MQDPASPNRRATDDIVPDHAGIGPSADSEITWLLHRAAQRMRSATEEQAGKHGIGLRDYIVLSALVETPGLTQAGLGKAFGLDRTTLMTQLDRLERMGLVVRRGDPRDRRIRIPEITEAGNRLRAKVSSACDAAEAAALSPFSRQQVRNFRHMLFDIIGHSEDPGSCL
jgi:DNA-binding MarR family transcriptional regulator